jgi:flagellar L-ring protein FlgH
MLTTSIRSRAIRLLGLVLAGAVLAGCSAADRLANVGSPPKLSAINDPTAAPGYRPVNMPMPAPEPPEFKSNSLWRSGARAFFKDQRASRVGDIMTVNVLIADRAQMDNRTARNRSGSEDFGARGAIGNKMLDYLPEGTSANAIVDLDSSGASGGQGSVNRKEELRTNVAAVVTQVLPNGNLVIEGRQEVRVNFEVRELIVAGIVRPEDISANNVIDSTKIAEARISYGGRGQITDVQQPRYGQQVLDILLPF